MSKKKFIFFDIDGTLTDKAQGGVVLPSTKLAIQKLRENGHFVALATGRAHFYAKPFKDEHGFENMVSDGGNGLTVDNELVGIEPLERAKALKVIDECIAKGIAFSVGLGDRPASYVLENAEVVDKLGIRKEIIRVANFHDIEHIYKIFIDATSEQERELASIHEIGYISHPDLGVIVEPLDKFKGIRKMVELQNGSLDDVVVFGDAANDLSMMEQAAMSIAMGNAIDEVKKVATFVTKDNDDDGIYYACEKFGWI